MFIFNRGFSKKVTCVLQWRKWKVYTFQDLVTQKDVWKDSVLNIGSLLTKRL